MTAEVKLTKEQRLAKLNAEVEEFKRRKEAKGDTTPKEDTKVIEVGLMNRVFCLADVMKPATEFWQKKAEAAKRFGIDLRKFAATQGRFCDEHENTKLPVDYDKSFSKSWYNREFIKAGGDFTICYGNCPKCARAENDSLVNESWIKFGVPDNLIDCTLENYATDGHEGKIKALEKVTAQIKRRGFIILRGTVGTGKTHLAVGALKKVGGLMVTEADLLGELRKTYNSKEVSADDVVNKYRKCECLVIDELDSEVTGIDIPQLLYRILARRYDDGKLTILTSNEELDTILEILGIKLTDRIKDNYVNVKFAWESHRGNRGPEFTI
jgi:DNA replication protein DnaC